MIQAVSLPIPQVGRNSASAWARDPGRDIAGTMRRAFSDKRIRDHRADPGFGKASNGSGGHLLRQPRRAHERKTRRIQLFRGSY